MTAFVQAYGGAAAIVISSIVIGRAICAAGGERRWWAAPAVGFGTLIVVEGAAIKLPGRDATAIAAWLVALAIAGGLLVRRRQLRIRWGDVVLAGVSVLGASLPFIANGRVGLPGVSMNNDSAHHLLYAEALRSSRMASLWGPANGYPLGPHSVTVALGSATSMALDLAFTALLLAIVPLTAITAAGVVADQGLWRRTVVGALCSLAYLLAAYYGEGAFKETIMALLLLACVLHAEQAQATWAGASAGRRTGLVVPVVLLVAAAVYTYSYVGLAWFGVAAGLWVLAELVRRPRAALGWAGRRNLRAAAPWLAATAVIAVIVLAPVVSQAVTFFHTVGFSPAGTGAIGASALGNLAHPLSAWEMLGIWWAPDFRFSPTTPLHGALSGFALAVLVYGAVWSVRRRQLLMPAAVAACVLIWWRSEGTQSPYVTAKALVIAAPLVMALGLRGLLRNRGGRLPARAAWLAIGAAFCAFAAYSSYEALRDEPVQAPEAGRELAAFARTIGDSSVLFLGDDDYAPWQLRPAAVTALTGDTHTPGSAIGRSQRSFPVEGQAVDFDSVIPADLDRFRFVITTNTAYTSQPPSNFRLLSSSRLYELWERTGPTAPRLALDPPGAPGAVLDCSSPLGRTLRRARGVASVTATPVLVPAHPLYPGTQAAVQLPLGPGRWEISIQYVSPLGLQLSSEGKQWKMPPYLGRWGPFFGVGEVIGRGPAEPVELTVRSPRPSVLTGPNLYSLLPLVAATRAPASHELVPLSHACGRYVDWYRVA
jgi:hypothetical protein